MKKKSIESFDKFLRKLFPLCRSLSGEMNRKTLKILQEIIPLKIKEIESKTKVFDWEIPLEWNIKEAWIKDSKGNKIIDFNENNLHLVSYSIPIKKILSWPELKKHLHLHKEISDAIPYRTTYYKKDWGFCVTHKQFELLESLQGDYQINIGSEFKDGSLSYGELILKGKSKKEILISCYICHPSMANDSISGVLLAAFLANYIKSFSNQYWTYRFIFVPETIGAIAYCYLNKNKLNDILMGLVITTVGGPGSFSYKQSWEKDHVINKVIEEVLKEEKKDFVIHPFDIHGSDERQFSSPGFRINMSSLFKDKYYEYDAYHSSLDNLELVNGKQINETFELYKKIIIKLEELVFFKSQNMFCEPMLSKYDLYPKIGGSLIPNNKSSDYISNILWLMFYCDGTKDLLSISREIKVEFKELLKIAKVLKSKGLLEQL